MGKTAILVDGAFFIRRALRIFGPLSPQELADKLFYYSCKHLRAHNYHPSKGKADRYELYRIFYYDCPPLRKNLQHPITKKNIDFSKSENAKWRMKFIEAMTQKRKTAIRLGKIDEANTNWCINPQLTKKLINGTIDISSLTEDDIKLTTKQKGVDMRIGLDIASLAFKQQVDRIILISGDSDFVPAAKLARREGIDFVLDPMWANIKPDLFEHIDGLKSTFPDPNKKEDTEAEAVECDDAESIVKTSYDDFCEV